MGVLKESGSIAGQKACDLGDWTFMKCKEETERMAGAFTYYRKLAGDNPQIQAALAKIQDLLDKLINTKYVLWTREKLYGFFVYLSKKINELVLALSDKTLPLASYVYDALKDQGVALLNFITRVFDKIDEDAVTPLLYGTKNGAFYLIDSTKSTSTKVIEAATTKVVKPTATCLYDNVWTPSLDRAVSTKKCIISTGAWVDEKMSLSEWLWFAASRSQHYDEKILGGSILKTGQAALSMGLSIDQSYTGGKAKSFAVDSYEEFLSCKVKKAGVTSPGAPVYEKKKGR